MKVLYDSSARALVYPNFGDPIDILELSKSSRDLDEVVNVESMMLYETESLAAEWMMFIEIYTYQAIHLQNRVTIGITRKILFNVSIQCFIRHLW